MNNRQHRDIDNKQKDPLTPETVTLVTSKSGFPTMKVGGYLLHSSYDPVKEAKRLADIHYKNGYLHVLFGFGLGYLAKELLARMGENDHLMIIEPNRQVFQFALENADLGALARNDKVILSIGEDISSLAQPLHFYLRAGFLGKISYIESPNYPELYPELAQKTAGLLKECSMLELINVNTLHAFADRWQDNFISNLYGAMSAKPFPALVKKLSCPVIIAAAGPSLTKQLPFLRAVQNKAFVLCAGSAINSLLRGEVTPHAVVTVDGGEANFNHFKALNIDSIPLIYSLFVHKGIPRKHAGVQIVFNETDSKLARWINRAARRDFGSVKGGQSVANFCFDLACQMTSGPVCFVGQDLAYTGNNTHAEGNINHKKISQKDIEGSKRYTRAKGYYGDLVLTDYVFLGMKKTFENYIEHLRNNGDNRPIINATEGGVMIEGAQNMAFSDFIQKYCYNDYSDEIRGLFDLPGIDQPNWNHLLKIIDKEKKKIGDVIKLCQKAQKKLTNIIPENKEISQTLLDGLDKIDQKLKRLLEHDLMHYILQPVIFRVQYRYPEPENETPEERTRRVLEKSRSLYREISEAAGRTEKYLEDLLKKIETHLDLARANIS